MVAYALLVECLVYKDLGISRDLPRIFGECASLVGGFMIILCVALGFTEFLILAEVPTQALDWVQTHIDSPWMFLLALNVFLIIVGALMDIYSAVIVVVPLIAPMAAAYGIDPTHLGIIFLANMELGYLMPPMGENLFLSSLPLRPIPDEGESIDTALCRNPTDRGIAHYLCPVPDLMAGGLVGSVMVGLRRPAPRRDPKPTLHRELDWG